MRIAAFRGDLPARRCAPPGLRAFLPLPACAGGQNPRRGDLFIEDRDPPPFFLFLSDRITEPRRGFGKNSENWELLKDSAFAERTYSEGLVASVGEHERLRRAEVGFGAAQCLNGLGRPGQTSGRAGRSREPARAMSPIGRIVQVPGTEGHTMSSAEYRSNRTQGAPTLWMGSLAPSAQRARPVAPVHLSHELRRRAPVRWLMLGRTRK